MSCEAKEIVTDPAAVNALISRLGQELGQGLYGTVHSIDGEQDKVVKEISTLDLSEHSVAALEKGIITLTELSHPNLIRYEDIYKSNNAIYMTMARYACSLESTLRAYKRTNRSFSTAQVIDVAKQIGSALEYLHNSADAHNKDKRQEIVHGDVKLANILVNKEETKFVLTDLGFGDQNATTALMYCIAPEVLLGGKLTPAADMWSLGIVLYELSSKLKTPFLLEAKQPRTVYVAGWTPNLSAIKDVTIRSILEHILVLNPKERLTASMLMQVLKPQDEFSSISSMLEIRTLKKKLEEMEEKLRRLEEYSHDPNVYNEPFEY